VRPHICFRQPSATTRGLVLLVAGTAAEQPRGTGFLWHGFQLPIVLGPDGPQPPLIMDQGGTEDALVVPQVPTIFPSQVALPRAVWKSFRSCLSRSQVFHPLRCPRHPRPQFSASVRARDLSCAGSRPASPRRGHLQRVPFPPLSNGLNVWRFRHLAFQNSGRQADSPSWRGLPPPDAQQPEPLKVQAVDYPSSQDAGVSDC